MSKTYDQLAREIAALQASAQKLLAIESKGAVAKINDMIAKYNLSAGDLKFAPSAASPVKPAMPSKAAKDKGITSAKSARYSDGKSNVWGGRGPRPAWLRGAIAAGRTIESFLTGAASEKKVAAKSVTFKRVANKPVVSPVGSAKKVSATSKSSTAKTAAKVPAAKKSQARKPAPAAAPAAPPVSVTKAASKKALARKIAAAKPGKKPAVKKAPVAKKSVPASKTTQSASAVQKASTAKLAAATTPETSTPAA